MGRILIKFNECTYRLLTFDLSHSDGSFYVAFVRQGKSDKHWRGEINLTKNEVVTGNATNEEKPKGARVSYHASGFIKFHNLRNQGIYGEPIFQITKPFGFFRYSIPSVEKLDVYTKPVSEDDIVLEISEALNSRVNFDCVIAPWNFVDSDSLGVSIRYEKLFSFSVLLNNEVLPIPPELNDYFHYLSPSIGTYNQSAFNKETALLNFHQKVQNTRNLIVYSPNREGVYTIIFSVPMRIPPEVHIDFEETGLQAEILDLSYTYLRFRVKDKHGQIIKNEVKLNGMELNAEL